MVDKFPQQEFEKNDKDFLKHRESVRMQIGKNDRFLNDKSLEWVSGVLGIKIKTAVDNNNNSIKFTVE